MSASYLTRRPADQAVVMNKAIPGENHSTQPNPDDGYASLLSRDYLPSMYKQPVTPKQNHEGILGLVYHTDMPGKCNPWNLYDYIDRETKPERPLGHGAFGVVWLCVDPRDRRQVALKRVPRVFHNLITAKRVFREIRALKHLKHQNIISLRDIALSADYESFREVFFVFEVMQTDLHRIIVSSQPLSTDHVQIFIYQILRGLSYIHSAGIIHRDIKPGNMLVNSNCLLKICDFGLARLYEPKTSEKLTHEVVTQYYRAPELLMESSWYSFGVDIWSAGCTFAELILRKILFPTSNPLVHLGMIFDLVGTSVDLTSFDRCHAEALKYVKRKTMKVESATFFKNFPDTCPEGIALLRGMLSFSPATRISASSALDSPFLNDARLRYHSCMCDCCHNVKVSSPRSSDQYKKKERKFCANLDPTHPEVLDWMDNFPSVLSARQEIRFSIYSFVRELNNVWNLGINTNASKYESLMQSSVAKSKKNPSMHCW